MTRLALRALATLAASGMAVSTASAQQTQAVSEQEAYEIARDAYVYAYPMVIMEITRRVGTNVAQPEGLRAPVNQIANVRAFPDASFTDVVRPNADTLYSALNYDVSKDPMVFSVPDSGARYYLLPMLDMWTDVFTVPGKRTTGTGAQTFAVVGPHWQGQLPKGVEAIRSPTSIGLMIGRTQTNGKADYAAVHKFQDGLKAVPLSHYGKAYTPPKGTVNANQDMSAPPDQVAHHGRVQPAEPLRDGLVELGGADARPQQPGSVAGVEQRPAGDPLVQHTSEREHVRSRRER